jgi:transposase
MSETPPKERELDIRIVSGMLERIGPLISAEERAHTELALEMLSETTRQLHQRDATLTRIRRLWGIRASEKFRDVFAGANAPTGEDPGPSAGDDHGSADDDRDADDAGDLDRGDTGVRDPGDPGDPDRGGDTANGDPATAEQADGDRDRDGARKRKGHGRIGAAEYPHARCVRVEHDGVHAGDTCQRCAHGKLYRVREPECIVRIVGQAPLAAHKWELDRYRCGGCGSVFTAPAPAEAQGPKYDEHAVAMMALLRYGGGMPLHRLDRLQRNLETPVPASTQWEVVRDHVDALAPVHDELCRQAASGRVLHNDDTSVRILELMGKRRAELVERGALPDPDRTGLFTTGIVSITEAGPIALFFSGRKHGGENFTSLLGAREPGLPAPIHMCDGLDRNRPTGHTVIEDNCLAHGRRHIVDEANNFPAECRHVLEMLGKVFKTDHECKKQAFSDDERLAVHQRDSAPVMDELKRWMIAQLDDKRIEPNSGLGDAFQYLLKRWNKITLFVRVAGAPLDNNICERILKMAIRHRNNSLFYRTLRGARVGDIYMALIHTAELHHENPFEYLVALLVHADDVAAEPAAWLPWTFRATLARVLPAAA